MSKQTNLLTMMAAFLMGISFFSFFYPIFIKLFAPARAWVSFNPIYLLAASFFLLYRSFFFRSTNPELITDNSFQSDLAKAIRQSNRFQIDIKNLGAVETYSCAGLLKQKLSP